METVWLVIGTIGMAAGAAAFAYLWTRKPPDTPGYFYAITLAIAVVAALAYFVMATGGGSTLLESNGVVVREFYFARYIDWLITTPLLLLDLALLALAAPGRNVGLIASLIVLDVVMILTGLWAGGIVGPGRWLLFIISMTAFIALLYLLITQLFAAARARGGAPQRIFNILAVGTIILWACYPIVWFIGTEGVRSVGPGVEVFLFMVLDLLAKIGFGFLLLTNHEAMTGGSGGQARASRVR